jgi:hypothetical protein
MASPRAYSGPLRERPARRRRSRTRKWTVAGLLAATALVVTVLLAAFSSPPSPLLACESGLLETGRPLPAVIAFQGEIAIQLPVSCQSVTALGYHGASGNVLPLEPVGRQANEGIFARILHRLTEDEASGITYHQLSGGTGPKTGALDVGAPAGTAVYAPVNGTVVSIRDFVLDGMRYGHRIDVVPDESPSVVVSIRRLRADPSLTVGSSVTKGTSKIGKILDLSRAEGQALADVTNDPGNHVTIEVRPAANLGP